jgi:hypothetical protein
MARCAPLCKYTRMYYRSNIIDGKNESSIYVRDVKHITVMNNEKQP